MDPRERAVLIALSGFREPVITGKILPREDFRVIGRILNDAQRKGFVTWINSDPGRQKKLWEITDAGRAAINDKT